MLIFLKYAHSVNPYFPNFPWLMLQKSCMGVRSFPSVHKPINFNVTGYKKNHWYAFRFHTGTNI